MSKKIYEIISNVMDCPITEINDDTNPESIDNWDSSNSLILLDQLESKFQVKFELDEIENVNSVKDIKKYLSNHGVVLDD